MKFSVLLALLVVATSALADNMPVNNPSFENGGTLTPSCGGNCLRGFDVPQWSTIGAAGILQPGAPYPNALFNYIPNGQNVAFIDSGTVTNGRIYQIVGNAIPGVTYTLQVDFGWEFNQAYPTQFAYLVVGGNRAIAAGTAPTQGNWSTFTATYNAGVTDNGNPIEIQLGLYAGTEAVFDDVRLSNSLSTTPTPEPAGLLLLGSGLGLVPLTRRRVNR